MPHRVAASSHVGHERELRHDQHAPSDIDDRRAHPFAVAAVVVVEDAEIADLCGDVFDIGGAISTLDADEHQQAAADLAGGAFLDADAGADDSLNDSSHSGRIDRSRSSRPNARNGARRAEYG